MQSYIGREASETARRRYTSRPIPGSKPPTRSVGERITDAMELAPVFGKMKCPITLSGNRQIIIEDVRGIRHIDENIISLSSGKGEVQILGSYLNLCAISESCAIITGEIKAVEFAF